MENFPKNIGIIMDGNGRWAQRRGLPISLGHRQGAEALGNIVKYCSSISDLESLTTFAFSTENWKRPKEEVDYIMGLFKDYLDKFFREEEKLKNLRIRFIGNFSRLDGELVDGIRKIEERTKDNVGLKFDIALSYGGRLEIVDACKRFAKDVLDGKAQASNLDESGFKNYLYDNEIGDLDLVIRTGGDLRLSNFFLWQLPYSELYFTDTLWPDFNEKALDAAIEDFKHRKRTFGERRAKR
jgi:undecaprenyl diphosphate synthase